jgi:signal transduction histidine kinase
MPVRVTVGGMAAGKDVAEVPRPPLFDRVTEGQWRDIDVAVAVAAAFVVIFDFRLMRGPRFLAPTPAEAVLGLAATLPVAVRRNWPVPVLAVVTVGIAGLTALDRAPLEVDVMLGMAAYMVAVRSSLRVALIAVTGIQLAILAGVIAAAAAGHSQPDKTHSMLAAGAMWFVGYGVRERRRYLAEGQAQRERAEAERSGRALREERVRIARELHDVVAHTLSVVTFQAGVGRKVGATRPAEALLALRAVEVTGRGALEELRRILGLLRDDEAEQPSLAPAPGVGDLGELADTIRAAGIPVALMVTGEVAALPPAASLTVYRIVQEALTNVVKHAPGAEASVRVRLGPDGVLVTVSDNGGGTAVTETAGSSGANRLGIVGMRERAAAFGGTLEAGPRPGGGFEVRACMPVRGLTAGQVA